ncbi:MAG: tetratricopeptide repeat protein, partial [Acidobacteriota bacterium]
QAGVSETAAPETSASDASQVREVDLSVEWASLSSAEEPPAESTQQDSLVEEAEFYLQAGLVDEAKAALERLREQSPSHPEIESLAEKFAALGGETAGVETAEAEASPAPELVSAEPSAAIETSPAMEVSESPVEKTVKAAPEPQPEPQMEATLPEAATPEPEAESVPAVAGEETEQSVADDGHPELMLEEISASHEHDSHAPAFELSLEEAPAQEKGGADLPQDPLAGLAGDLEKGFVPPSAPSGAGQPQANLLGDILAEFKDEVEEQDTGGDLETHYNMGVAFKEMALYEEAIGEFQKVHQLAEQLKDTSYLLRCCSLLAVCFLAKGLPELAVKWYQTALDAPSLGAENRLGLLYEMAAAYEVAGDRESALKRFKEVYALNIDYRDVTDRISALQQAQ